MPEQNVDKPRQDETTDESAASKQQAPKKQATQANAQTSKQVSTHASNATQTIMRSQYVVQPLKKQQQEQIKLVLIGQGREKAKLKELASQHQLNNIVFLEPVAKVQLAQLMQRANVGLQVLANIPAFYYGTSPNKFFDYIAAGLPVINNYPGWLAELIETHQCGIAVTPEDPIAFANALIKMKSDPQLCEQMAFNAQDLAREQFSRVHLSNQFIGVFESLEGGTT